VASAADSSTHRGVCKQNGGPVGEKAERG
jgi:hypothetical protein